jgi:hypothetical protein
VYQVIKELEYLKNRYNPALFYFGDEMIMADTDYAAMDFMAVNNKLNSLS